jgi:hypothetical protein
MIWTNPIAGAFIARVHTATECVSSIRISKVDRVSNSVAHSLAQLGKSGISGCILGSGPTCVLEDVQQDCNLAMQASSFRRTLFIIRVPKGTRGFLMSGLLA